MKTMLLGLLVAAAGGEPPPAYVLGSSVNLRKEAGKTAEVLQKLPIGTECRTLESLEGGWARVRCGEAEGFVVGAFLGPEKPSVEKLAAEAKDPKRTLLQREESALRAATLAPEDAGLQKALATLFFERNLEAVARLKKPSLRRPFEFDCTVNDPERCLRSTSTNYVDGLKVRVGIRDRLFVIALGSADSLTVYRGRFRFDNRRFEETAQIQVKGEVLEQASSPLTSVLDKALFSGVSASSDVYSRPSFGQYVLDDAELAFFRSIPSKWALLSMKAEDGIPRMRWDACMKRPYRLVFDPDIHGRVLVMIESEGGGLEFLWVAAVSKNENTLRLTLADIDGEKTRQESFRLPDAGGDIAYLGELACTHVFQKYPDLGGECLEGGP
ncbi:SH3 domain-containing protein [Myxococcus sp. MxC21-1]|uniref:SH3 domain-containing protein n=1 Tax=Myxococcus sp. MxC21-1 TaxID=3041439 RepID=UPI00292DD659|nr:SH3 domain-containing protein [Myxococcus sp. MxC21-1]WNZ58695.1 SH3 domain-containing protein [Myxococcus sp. MxC21-1]